MVRVVGKYHLTKKKRWRCYVKREVVAEKRLAWASNKICLVNCRETTIRNYRTPTFAAFPTKTDLSLQLELSLTKLSFFGLRLTRPRWPLALLCIAELSQPELLLTFFCHLLISILFLTWCPRWYSWHPVITALISCDLKNEQAHTFCFNSTFPGCHLFFLDRH